MSFFNVVLRVTHVKLFYTCNVHENSVLRIYDRTQENGCDLSKETFTTRLTANPGLIVIRSLGGALIGVITCIIVHQCCLTAVSTDFIRVYVLAYVPIYIKYIFIYIRKSRKYICGAGETAWLRGDLHSS